MAYRTFNSSDVDYNYGHDNPTSVFNSMKSWFDFWASTEAKSYVRIVIDNERTNYHSVTHTNYVEQTHSTRPKKLTIDDARLVILGGPFQEIGGEDEAVGGGSQKLGETNQRRLHAL